LDDNNERINFNYATSQNYCEYMVTKFCLEQVRSHFFQKVGSYLHKKYIDGTITSGHSSSGTTFLYTLWLEYNSMGGPCLFLNVPILKKLSTFFH